MAESWVNVTCVDDTHEIEMDAYVADGVSDRARFRHRPIALTRWGERSRELGFVHEEWTPGLPAGHRWKKPPRAE